MKLTAKNVEDVVKDCLFRKEEVKDGNPIVEPITGEGLLRSFGFHPDRLKKHENDIIDMLNQLPIQFREKEGGGWSFLNGCMTSSDEQWGEQPNVETLFALGAAINRGKWIMKEMIAVLPGGVPYYVVLG